MSNRVRPCALAQLEAEVLGLYARPMRAAGTLAGMAQIFREIRAVQPDARTADLRPPLVAAWITAHPSRSAVRTEALLRNLRVICNYAVVERRLAVSPFKARPLRSWLRADAVPSRNTGKVYRRSQVEIAQLLRLLDAEAGTGWQARRLQALVYVYV